LATLTPLERLALQEYEVIGEKLLTNHAWSEVFLNDKMRATVTINGGDHLCISVIHNGFQLRKSLEKANAIDDEIDGGDYAFSPELGYLTSRPDTLGTGMRAAVFIHLPGLLLTEQIQYLVNAAQQIGISIENVYRDNSRTLGHVFSIFNQQTLGIGEGEEIRRLGDIVRAVMEQENAARMSFLEGNKVPFRNRIRLMDCVSCSCCTLTSDDALEMPLWMRFAVDLEIFDSKYRSRIDCLMVEIQPGNLSLRCDRELTAEEQDRKRATMTCAFFKQMGEPRFTD
jgi:protein arginine kinase